jgi:hypothetical protein
MRNYPNSKGRREKIRLGKNVLHGHIAIQRPPNTCLLIMVKEKE